MREHTDLEARGLARRTRVVNVPRTMKAGEEKRGDRRIKQRRTIE
jgi:hypothetical protein